MTTSLPYFFVKPDLGPKMYNAYGEHESAVTFCPILADILGILKGWGFYNDGEYLRLRVCVHCRWSSWGSVVKIVESLSLESTVIDMHYVIHIIRLHVT